MAEKTNQRIVSTGLASVDQILTSLRLGDNVVWQIDQIAEYQMCVAAYVRQAQADQRKLIYFRFGQHDDLLEQFLPVDTVPDDLPVHADFERCVLDPNAGFEHFTSQIYQKITEAGLEAFYVFDCLSDLLEVWASDLMIGNFFRIVCPYLFELDTIAYFALRRGQHAYEAIARIRETTQILLDLYAIDGQYYLHPLKVWQRYSPTMFLLHHIDEYQGQPITNSAEATELFNQVRKIASTGSLAAQTGRQIDYWDRLFQHAEASFSANVQVPAISDRLCHLLFGAEGQISRLTKQYFTLEDLFEIKHRQIGTGKIGGKAVGMLLARKIIKTASEAGDLKWTELLEDHDSFYLGSDLYYTYIVQNGWWKIRVEQKTEQGYFAKADELKQLLLTGQFPPSVKEQFQQMLEYYGQSPIIVRSSSLLEDGFGNAFAGKYESIFCANQGSPEERYEAFEQAVRIVYASTMNEQALNYRLKKGLAQQDEQMALLVQRVSGAYHQRYYYPLMAGVGFSNNLYVWDQSMDPDAGMLRLVYGLGTRAVDRVEGDYPRLVALDHPMLTTHGNRQDEKTYSQHYVDLIDLAENKLSTVPLRTLLQEMPETDMSLVADIDWEDNPNQRDRRSYQPRKTWVLSFRKFLKEMGLVKTLRQMLDALEKVYAYPVDVEFTINETSDHQLKLNLLQCRPLQTKGLGQKIIFPDINDYRNVLLQSNGNFMGGNVMLSIKHIIYVRPELYTQLNHQDRYEIARVIGQLNRALGDEAQHGIALLGPGRWGTTTPSLGVPVHFSEISNVNILAEVAFETAGMIPEISYGSHFFQDLVEANVFYVAILPHNQVTTYQPEFIDRHENRLAEILPDQSRWASIIHVVNLETDRLMLYSDVVSQDILMAQLS